MTDLTDLIQRGDNWQAKQHELKLSLNSPVRSQYATDPGESGYFTAFIYSQHTAIVNRIYVVNYTINDDFKMIVDSIN